MIWLTSFILLSTIYTFLGYYRKTLLWYLWVEGVYSRVSLPSYGIHKGTLRNKVEDIDKLEKILTDSITIKGLRFPGV